MANWPENKSEAERMLETTADFEKWWQENKGRAKDPRNIAFAAYMLGKPLQTMPEHDAVISRNHAWRVNGDHFNNQINDVLKCGTKLYTEETVRKLLGG